jgi:predicted trehalose synthase
VVGHHTSGPTDVVLTSSSVLRGEQSNTSIICSVEDPSGAPAEPIILKVFRTLQAGENPDVVVQSALTEAGSSQVPETVGYVSGRWLAPDHVEARSRHEADIDRHLKAAVGARTTVVNLIHKDRQTAATAHAEDKARVARERAVEIARRREAVRPTLHDALLGDKDQLDPALDVHGLPDPEAVPAPALPTRDLPRIPSRDEFPKFVPEVVGGHLAFAQRFFPGVEDAWRVALRAAGSGTDFTTQAGELGEATGRIHLGLAEALGTTPASADARHALLESIRARYAAALGEVPALARHERAVQSILDAFGALRWPDLQRVHGDYHLGQVLRVADRGWVAVDFEGEPLRPLAERVRPDLALRDVAGMLRSFDYAGGSVELSRPGTSARAWVEACRTAFLGGYAAVTHVDLTAAAATIRALELDKALYEVVYEARNRPTWLPIPATAIDRLVADSKGAP